MGNLCPVYAPRHGALLPHPKDISPVTAGLGGGGNPCSLPIPLPCEFITAIDFSSPGFPSISVVGMWVAVEVLRVSDPVVQITATVHGSEADARGDLTRIAEAVIPYVVSSYPFEPGAVVLTDVVPNAPDLGGGYVSLRLEPPGELLPVGFSRRSVFVLS